MTPSGEDQHSETTWRREAWTGPPVFRLRSFVRRDGRLSVVIVREGVTQERSRPLRGR